MGTEVRSKSTPVLQYDRRDDDRDPRGGNAFVISRRSLVVLFTGVAAAAWSYWHDWGTDFLLVFIVAPMVIGFQLFIGARDLFRIRELDLSWWVSFALCAAGILATVIGIVHAFH